MSIIENYEFKEKLAQGTYWAVYKAFDKVTRQYHAIKIYLKKFNHPDEWKALPEIVLMSKLDHFNLVKLHSVVYHQHQLFMIMEAGIGR